MAAAADGRVFLFALKEERDPFLARCRAVGRRVRRLASDRHRIDGPNGATLVVMSGMGQEATLAALARVEPASIVHAGFAGALRADIEPGSVHHVVSVREGPQLMTPNGNPGLDAVLAALPAARLVTAPAMLGVRDKRIMAEHRSGDLVDMESAVSLRCAIEDGVPWTGVRAVTDGLDDEIPPVVRAAFDGTRIRRGPLVRRAIFDGALRAQLLDLRRRAAVASERLAAVLIDLL